MGLTSYRVNPETRYRVPAKVFSLYRCGSPSLLLTPLAQSLLLLYIYPSPWPPLLLTFISLFSVSLPRSLFFSISLSSMGAIDITSRDKMEGESKVKIEEERRGEAEHMKGVRHLYDAGVTKVPGRYILPASERPHIVSCGDTTSTHNLKLPIIDLSLLHTPKRAMVLEALSLACKEFGFFQVRTKILYIQNKKKNRDRFLHCSTYWKSISVQLRPHKFVQIPGSQQTNQKAQWL